MPWPGQAEAETFVRHKGEYAAWFVTRLGLFPTMLSMGLEHFSVALPVLARVREPSLGRGGAGPLLRLDGRCGGARLPTRIRCLRLHGRHGLQERALLLPGGLSRLRRRDLVLPRYRRVAEKITIPWVIHSDGNVLPFLEDLLSLGIAGLHPIEKGALDIRAMKREYGGRLCLLGNVDLNLLGLGTPQEVEAEVHELIREVGPGGGYIVTSGNSLAGYLRPENVLALSEAVQKYGRYTLEV